jgi:hypothetical protein
MNMEAADCFEALVSLYQIALRQNAEYKNLHRRNIAPRLKMCQLIVTIYPSAQSAALLEMLIGA